MVEAIRRCLACGASLGELKAAALGAGLSISELARYIDTSVRVIDRTYEHLVRRRKDRARAKLVARATREIEEASRSSGPRPGREAPSRGQRPRYRAFRNS